jgi:glutamine amidotransferase
MKKIALIDYGTGNIRSVYNALSRIIADFNLSYQIIVTNNDKEIAHSDKIILPGVGAFKACVDGLNAYQGLRETINKKVLEQKTPFLGICVGMQMMAEIGEEFGVHQGLGYLPNSKVKHFPETDLKIPHMGWNKIIKHFQHPVLNEIETENYVYFVHSYIMNVSSEYVGLSSNYGVNFPAFICKDNMVGTQFHPEKSQKTGLTLLRNFLSWKI